MAFHAGAGRGGFLGFFMWRNFSHNSDGMHHLQLSGLRHCSYVLERDSTSIFQTMFPTLVRRLAQTSSRQLSTTTINPSKLKKVWPPDFTKLSPQEQLKFEKKYKRRVQLATARPRWNKFIKLSQLSAITCTLVLGV
jgi:hypothetical protein